MKRSEVFLAASPLLPSAFGLRPPKRSEEFPSAAREKKKIPGSRFARRIFFRPRLRACSQAIAKLLKISSLLTAFDTPSSGFQDFFRSNHFKRVRLLSAQFSFY